MRLIDADAFKSEGRELYREAGWDLREVHYSQLDVECNIDMMPTIEAEPTKHGRWKHHQYGNTAGYYVCDNCGKINSYESNYCPKCGAKMDEVSDCESCQNRKTCKDAPIPSRYDCLGYKSDEVEDE